MSLSRKRKKYEKDLLAVKYKLYTMVAMENYFFYNANTKEFNVDVLGWVGKESRVKIQIVNHIPEEDFFTVRAYFLPIKSKGKKFKSEYIHYIFTVADKEVERELLLSLKIPSIVNKGEKALRELKGFLSDKLDVVVLGNR